MVDKVKALQQRSHECKDLWHRECDALPGGHRDPLRHKAYFLEAFLEQAANMELVRGTSATQRASDGRRHRGGASEPSGLAGGPPCGPRADEAELPSPRLFLFLFLPIFIFLLFPSCWVRPASPVP